MNKVLDSSLPEQNHSYANMLKVLDACAEKLGVCWDDYVPLRYPERSSLFLYQWKWMMDMLKFLLATGFSILAWVRAKEDYVILQMSTLMK